MCENQVSMKNTLSNLSLIPPQQMAIVSARPASVLTSYVPSFSKHSEFSLSSAYQKWHLQGKKINKMTKVLFSQQYLQIQICVTYLG